MKDWYQHRHELESGMVFEDKDGDVVMLDSRVAGDGTKWNVNNWFGNHWSYEDMTVEPSDLVRQVADPAA